jgi:acyl-CoA thioester hydrolase
MQIRVYYEDTDAGGVVYYANYLKFCERARAEFFRERGIDMAEYHEKGIMFVIAHVDIHYRASARLGDLLEVESRISRVRGAGFSFSQRIFRSDDRLLLSEAMIDVACVDMAKAGPRRLPEAVREVVNQSLEGA